MKMRRVTGDIAALAIRALDGPEIDDLIGPQAITFLVLPLASLKVLEMRVGSDINFVPLIIEIRPFGDEGEVINRKAFFPKVTQVIIGLDLLDKPNATFMRLSPLTVFWESGQECCDLLQGDTVLLVVDDQAVFQGGIVRMLPLRSPDQGVEPCGVRRGPYTPQVVPNRFDLV